MSNYSVSKIYPSDKRAAKVIDGLLEGEGIKRDKNLDYTCGIMDEDYNIVATGSCFGNTIRCLAVSKNHQGEGLLNQVITHLMEVQFARGNIHLFLYTKCSTAKFFRDLGFYEIARIEDHLVFMENRRTGFSDYLKKLAPVEEGAKISALVMNANPFTKGHQYLVEKAAAESDILHLFIVNEDVSLVPFSVRKDLVMAGTAHLKNIRYHDSGPYIISNATFPSYFQKDEQSVVEGHALLDLTIFGKIAESLQINCRYVGDEPTSEVTNIYNQTMAEALPKMGIDCIIVPRIEAEGKVISASTVRQAIQDGDFETFKELVPETTYAYFTSPEAEKVIEKIKTAGNVIHH